MKPTYCRTKPTNARSGRRDNDRVKRTQVNCGMHPFTVPVLRKFAANRGFSTSRMLEIAAITYMQTYDAPEIDALRAKAPEIFP